ncbi:hypothetical protein BJV77DRAFT_1020505 [Russula vinacea]|nr:hypothetical protein BJV77DRAFT_1020505 [Russula vinacea]
MLYYIYYADVLLPFDTNIYGLVFRWDVLNSTIQIMWNLNATNPIDEIMLLKLHITSGYGSRSLDLEHSCALSPNSFQSHCVFLFSAGGSDIIRAYRHPRLSL